MTTEAIKDVKDILTSHSAWLSGDGEPVDLTGVNLFDLRGVDLTSATMQNIDLSYTNLNDANLCGADLWYANLRYANLIRAILRDTNLSNASLRRANFSYADLTKSNLSGADLHGANLSNADLRGANLSNADLRYTNLSGADLRNVDLTGANLVGIIGNMKHIKSLRVDKYPITYTHNMLQIGCRRYTIDNWKDFDDTFISKMDTGALEWWNNWKLIIFKMIDKSPCEPTK